jgi:YesN/AraC family two-component response regulator
VTASQADKLVLLIDDEDSLREGMQAWLRDNQGGFAVMSASDGMRGLELIKRHKPDLVISDIRMPGMDGLQLLLECRRSFPEIRFIIMSAYGTRDVEEKSLQCGALRFLKKPVDLPHLEETIIEVLKQEPATTRGGFLEGISVPGFVQLLNMERQSARLILKQADGQTGMLYFEDGALVHAVMGELSGEAAAEELLAWEQAEMLIERECGQYPRTVEKSLNFLIMDAVRAKDERERG